VLTEPLAFEVVSSVKNGRALNWESRRRQRHRRLGLRQRRQKQTNWAWVWNRIEGTGRFTPAARL